MDYNKEVICKDCRHSHRSIYNKIMFVHIYQCRLPENIMADDYDPVTGRTRQGDYNSCRIARLQSSVCGPEGRRWKPKNSRKHLFTVLKKNYDRTT